MSTRSIAFDSKDKRSIRWLSHTYTCRLLHKPFLGLIIIYHSNHQTLPTHQDTWLSPPKAGWVIVPYLPATISVLDIATTERMSCPIREQRLEKRGWRLLLPSLALAPGIRLCTNIWVLLAQFALFLMLWLGRRNKMNCFGRVLRCQGHSTYCSQ